MEEKDIQQGFQELSKMLSTDEGQKQISDIISMLQGDESSDASPLSDILSSLGASSDNEKKEDDSSSQNSGSGLDFEALGKIKGLLSSSGKNHNQNTALLQSLKPFLRDERKEKIDSLIKIMSYASIFKSFGGFMKGGD